MISILVAVENNKIIALHLKRGCVSPITKQRMGKLSPDATYIDAGLLPIVGTQPQYNPETQKCSGPTYEINGDQIDKVFTVTDKTDAEIQRTLRDQHKQKQKISVQKQLKNIKNIDAYIDSCDQTEKDNILKLLIKKVLI